MKDTCVINSGIPRHPSKTFMTEKNELTFMTAREKNMLLHVCYTIKKYINVLVAKNEKG